MAAPIIVERNYLVAGKRVTVQAYFPATLAKEIGQENLLACAQRVLLRVEAKGTEVRELRLGD